MAIGTVTTPKSSGQTITSSDMNQILDIIQEGSLTLKTDMARIGVQGADPSGGDLVEGLLWYLGTTDTLKYRDGTGTRTVANLDLAQTFAAAMTFTTGVLTNTVSERTGGSGVTIDGVLLKDSYMELSEITAPATPAANKIRFYSRDAGSKSALFYKNDDGTEFPVGGFTYDGNDVTVLYGATETVSEGLVNPVSNNADAAGGMSAPGFTGMAARTVAATSDAYSTMLGIAPQIRSVSNNDYAVSHPAIAQGYGLKIRGTYKIDTLTAVTASTIIGWGYYQTPSNTGYGHKNPYQGATSFARGAHAYLDTSGNLFSHVYPAATTYYASQAATDSTYNIDAGDDGEFIITFENANAPADSVFTVEVEDNGGTLRTILDIDFSGATNNLLAGVITAYLGGENSGGGTGDSYMANMGYRLYKL